MVKPNRPKSDKVEEFIATLRHTKGAYAGHRFFLLPWQQEVVRRLYDTVDEDGWRRYRYCYIEIPKKNGKTCLGAALALFHLCCDGEEAAEVYSAACDREQASIIYRQAVEFVRSCPDLERRLVIRESSKRLIYPKKNSYYQVLSSESFTKHGLNPSAIFFDELHAQPNDELWRVLTSGTDYARKQQLVFVMTTAGVHNPESIWWRIRSKAIQIASGIVKQDDFLPFLYIADPEKDNPDDEEVWKRVNPSIGQIFTLEKIRKDYETAKQDPVAWSDFLRFRLNIPVKHIGRWLPMDAWDACVGDIDEASLDGLWCYGGLDLSSRLDLTAFVLVFPPQPGLDKHVIIPRFYCPEDTILERSRSDRVRYDVWVKDGHIVATPGNAIDAEYIMRDIIRASERYVIREIGYDPWAASVLAIKLANEHGINMVEMRQGSKTLSEPAKSLLAAVMRGEVLHGGHPVLRWCADNLVMVRDANENIRPDKEKATDRIDGMVALIMAWGRAMINVNVGSVYEDRDPIVFTR